jgi:hypothetical protein
MLKDKIITLSNDIDRISRIKPATIIDPSLENENRRLRQEIAEI